MALPSLGAISMADYNTELKNPNGTQISMNQATFRRITGKTQDSSSISMSDGYGKSAAFVITRTISGAWANYDLRADAIALGWDAVTPLDFTVTVDYAGYVYSASTGSYAFYISPTFPAGSKIRLNNFGYIVGKGGAGGDGYSYYPSGAYVSANNPYPGGGGGPAIYVGFSTSINNGGVIGGGGGGGGGGGAI